MPDGPTDAQGPRSLHGLPVRTFLRHIRVDSLDEVKARILQGVDEFNEAPVVFRWNKFDLGLV